MSENKKVPTTVGEVFEDLAEKAAFEVELQSPSTSFELALSPKTWTREETEARIIEAMKAAAVTAKGQKPKEWYGTILECRNIILGEKKKMATQDAGNIEVDGD